MGGGSGASRTPLLLTTLHLLPPTYYDYLLQGERHFSYRHTHVRGRAILHCGHHRHGADDLASGEIVDPNPEPSDLDSRPTSEPSFGNRPNSGPG